MTLAGSWMKTGIASLFSCLELDSVRSVSGPKWDKILALCSSLVCLSVLLMRPLDHSPEDWNTKEMA